MVTLTGTFTRLDGTPATGTVRVTPSRSPIMDPDGKIVISGPQTFPLGVDGTLSVPIPASNDPDLGPPFTYWIDVNLSHANWKISKVWIPHGSTTVDLSEIGDYTPTPGVATRTVTIPADGTDGQVLVWDGAGFSWEFPPKGDKGDQGDPGTSDIVVDTSVGTRVFTNGVMVHGDTGWRDVTSLLQPGALVDRSLRFIRIRNLNGIVHFQGNLTIDPATLVDGRIINLPPGWGPGKYGTWGQSSIGAVATIASTSTITMVGWTNQTSVSFSVSWPTTEPWPTTLPGTPL